jgi:hypothetical protein
VARKKKKPQNDPKWLEEFQELANQQLGEGSSCEQVHPVVERWLTKLFESEPPTSRPSVEQAMACLTTEMLNLLPEEVLDTVLETMDEDELIIWVETVLLIGRAFETSLNNGELDDL